MWVLCYLILHYITLLLIFQIKKKKKKKQDKWYKKIMTTVYFLSIAKFITLFKSQPGVTSSPFWPRTAFIEVKLSSFSEKINESEFLFFSFSNLISILPTFWGVIFHFSGSISSPEVIRHRFVGFSVFCPTSPIDLNTSDTSLVS